jgi:hypothetical protein
MFELQVCVPHYLRPSIDKASKHIWRDNVGRNVTIYHAGKLMQVQHALKVLLVKSREVGNYRKILMYFDHVHLQFMILETTVLFWNLTLNWNVYYYRNLCPPWIIPSTSLPTLPSLETSHNSAFPFNGPTKSPLGNHQINHSQARRLGSEELHGWPGRRISKSSCHQAEENWKVAKQTGRNKSCNILSRVLVTKDGGRISNWIYWPLTGRNCK